MSTSTITRTAAEHLSEPIVPATRGATQAFSTARKNPLALDATAAAGSIDNLNQLLADTLTLRDLYKKHHWQASGPSFYVMHLLFDKHFEEQSKLVDLLAERVQTLGGVSIAMAPDVAEATLIPRAPKDREDTATQIARLLQAHEVILLEARRWPEIPQSVAIWEPTTSLFPMSSAPTSCRCGSLPSTCNEHNVPRDDRKESNQKGESKWNHSRPVVIPGNPTQKASICWS
jgi:starvation-inducible DNA-binding protein